MHLVSMCNRRVVSASGERVNGRVVSAYGMGGS